MGGATVMDFVRTARREPVAESVPASVPTVEAAKADMIRREVLQLELPMTSTVRVDHDAHSLKLISRLWDAGIGAEIGYATFADYANSIPVAPKDIVFERVVHPKFPTQFLAETRVSVPRFCTLAGIKFFGHDDEYVTWRSVGEYSEPTWLWGQNGFCNRGHCAFDSLDAMDPDESALTVLQGLSMYVQNRNCIKGHGMLLPGSVRLRWQSDVASLLVNDLGSILIHTSDLYMDPTYGSASHWVI